jgi:autoinducer 2-degrading protein
MHVTLVDIHIRPEALTAFVEACRLNHEGSVAEPGNRRFDVLQDADDPCHFVLYEAYVDEAAAKAHKQTAHYFAWRDTVADMMESPRQGRPFVGLFPRAD